MLHVIQLSFCNCLICFNVSFCLLECLLLVILVFFVVLLLLVILFFLVVFCHTCFLKVFFAYLRLWEPGREVLCERRIQPRRRNFSCNRELLVGQKRFLTSFYRNSVHFSSWRIQPRRIFSCNGELLVSQKRFDIFA